jgi:hypothetical protein
MKKTVLLKIQVPEGDYCWRYNDPNDKSLSEFCEYFDNEGGHLSCKLDFSPLEKGIDPSTKKELGIKKPLDCGKLETLGKSPTELDRAMDKIITKMGKKTLTGPKSGIDKLIKINNYINKRRQ